ncbi:helix-turn-helix transcriptional regulator [Actinomadura roseirufa]|uniref:helix-turn-helix transcriptional regulator n=1 Tax=Actinomadura roseirufa TaxID=2094049 RepID=UPI00104179E4|nr:helix-turn-helix transcriptional regulator [Actinomadura roseirufa]
MTDSLPKWARQIKSERESRGWTKPDLARRMYRTMGITQGNVTSLARQITWHEYGQHRPTFWASAYAAVFETTVEELFDIPDTSAIPSGTVNPSPTPDPEDDEVKRRATLQIISAIAAGTVIPPRALENILSGVQDALGNPLNLDAWEAAVHEHGRLLELRPIGDVIGALLTDLVAVGDLLKRHGGTPATSGLFRVSAGLSGMLAIKMSDFGDQRAARLSWTNARQAADASGDQDLRVWVRGRAAQEAFWAQQSGEVVTELATEAIEVAAGRPSGGLAGAYSARAFAAAEQGDVRQVPVALAELKRTVDRLPEPRGLLARTPLDFREPQLHWTDSYAHSRIGAKKAEATITRAHAAYPATSFVPRANLSVMRAAVLVKERDVDSGLNEAVTTLRSQFEAEVGNIPWARRLGRNVLDALPEKARALPAARELHALSSPQNRPAALL